MPCHSLGAAGGLSFHLKLTVLHFLSTLCYVDLRNLEIFVRSNKSEKRKVEKCQVFGRRRCSQLPGLSLLEGWGQAAHSKRRRRRPRASSCHGRPARNFMPYWSQLLSKEAHERGAATEILNCVDGEAVDREARARLRTAGS